MKVRTHLVRSIDGKCEYCQMEIPLIRGRKPLPGSFIGVIESALTGNESYKLGKHDSNKRCYEA